MKKNMPRERDRGGGCIRARLMHLRRDREGVVIRTGLRDGGRTSDRRSHREVARSRR
jgi:hypothetical protein